MKNEQLQLVNEYVIYANKKSIYQVKEIIDTLILIKMEKLNKYWNLSWWYIFDYLDKKSHELAEWLIWECETLTVEIKYFWHITEDDLERFTIFTFDRLWKKENNKVMIDSITKWVVFTRIIFVKKK